MRTIPCLLLSPVKVMVTCHSMGVWFCCHWFVGDSKWGLFLIKICHLLCRGIHERKWCSNNTKLYRQRCNTQVSTEEFLLHVTEKCFTSYWQKGLICKSFIPSLWIGITLTSILYRTTVCTYIIFNLIKNNPIEIVCSPPSFLPLKNANVYKVKKVKLSLVLN
jgi:hypothetical protein